MQVRCSLWQIGPWLVAMLALAGCHHAPASADTPQGTPRPAPHTLAVAFWNLEWFPGRHPHARADAQAAHVAAVTPIAARLDADVLGLEEIADRDAAGLVAGSLPGCKVDVCSEFLRGPEAKPRRRSRAKSHGDDEESPDELTPPDDGQPWTEPDHQQIALCSRLPVLAAGAQAWRPDAEGRRQRRGFVWAVYRTAPGEAVLIYGLHLKSNVLDEPGGQPTNILLREEASRQLRAHQQATVAAWAGVDRLRLVVIGGDMNTSLDDGQFTTETTLRTWLGEEGFRWGWDGVPLPRRLTLPAKGRYPATCFDHVLYRSVVGPVPSVTAALAESGPAASDHRPVVTRFSW